MNTYLEERCRIVDKALGQYLPSAKTRPATIHEAMRYSIFAGGKRLRPILCLASAEACDGAYEAASPPPPRWSASTPTRSSTTIFPAWTTTISVAACRRVM